MPFRNRIRLPIQVTRPQYPEDRSVMRLANGTTKTLSVVVRKTYEGNTDWMPENWHERFKIALAHDNVVIEGDKYLGGVSQEGDYNIEWQTFLDFPIAPAAFKVNVTPFNATNSNCMTCAEATQLDLVDDTFSNAYGEPIDMQEETDYTLNVAANDDICCFPSVFSLATYNATYLSAASIDQSGVLSVTTKAGLLSANNILLATYRVTCPNGSYDEADVYGNIDGSIEGCLAPINVAVSGITPFSAFADWGDPTPAPLSYEWKLFEMQNPGTPVQTGTVPVGGVFPVLSGLDDGTDYGFYVRSVCDGTNSNYVEILFTTPVNTESCGRYRIHYNDNSGLSTNSVDVTYLDCNSNYQTVTVFNFRSRVICAQQTTEGNPVHIENATSIDYEGLC